MIRNNRHGASMSKPIRRLVAGAAGLSAVAFLAGCANDAPQDTWQPKGPNAQKIDDLQKPVFEIGRAHV